MHYNPRLKTTHMLCQGWWYMSRTYIYLKLNEDYVSNFQLAN